MLEVENIIHIFSCEVIERQTKAGWVLGGRISIEDEARLRFALPYSAELPTHFPSLHVPSYRVAVKMIQVVREKQCLN